MRLLRATLLRDWNEFWFQPIPSGPLGLFRIVFGGVLVAWGLLLSPPDLYTWFSEQGVLPVAANSAYGFAGVLDLLSYTRDPHVLLALYLVYMTAAICMTIGLGTRPAMVVAFFCLLTFHNRDPIMLNGGDTLERIVLFYLIFAPAGASCSVDRLIAIARGKEAAGEPPLIEPWPQRLIQLQVSAVYLSTVMSKSEGAFWQNGTALYFPLHLTQFSRFPLGPLPDLMWAINLGTFGAVAIEFSLATFVWVPRLRGYVLAAGVLLHSGIDYAMNIPLFSALMISTYINFCPNEWLAGWAGYLSHSFTRYRLEVIYHDGTDAARRSVAVLERMDAARLLTLVPDEGSDAGPTGIRVRGRGWTSDGTDAMRRVLACLPALWLLVPALLIPGSARLLTPLVQPFAPVAAGPEARADIPAETLVSSERG